MSLSCRVFCLVLLGLVGCTAANNQPESAPRALPSAVAESSSSPSELEHRAAPDFELQSPSGPAPWTHLRPRASADSFQFAIVTDRTGGMRRGIFDSAVDKLNLLEPEFVMSVGDLIAGYTEDRALVERQWQEFDALVGRLKAPFFYVVGNHDISNSVMREVWQERLGMTRYSFVYKGVLFVCLDSMDGGHHQLGEAQLSWLAETLEQNTDVHWTLLFMHSPLWDDYKGIAGKEHPIPIWEKVEEVLGNRPYTAFAGHHHRFLKTHRHERNLYTLATTGGGSRLRGLSYGEFDHIVWVTMTPQGPLLANLLLNGIHSDDVRTEPLRLFHEQLQEGGQLNPHAAVVEGRFQSTAVRYQIHNAQDFPVELELESPGSEELVVSPEKQKLSLEPNSVQEASFQARAKHGPAQVSIPLTAPVHWRARAATDKQELTIDGESAIVVLKSELLPSTRPISVDGDLSEWGRLRYRITTPRQVRGNKSALLGPEDNHFSIGIRTDDEWLYVAVAVTDDWVEAKPELAPWQQDGIELRIDGRPERIRSHSHGHWDGQRFGLIALSPSDSADEVWLYKAAWITPIGGLVTRCVRTKTGYNAEVAIPRSYLDEAAGGQAQAIRVNVAVNDMDPGGRSQSWWWPDWRTGEDVPGSGTLELRPRRTQPRLATP